MAKTKQFIDLFKSLDQGELPTEKDFPILVMSDPSEEELELLLPTCFSCTQTIYSDATPDIDTYWEDSYSKGKDYPYWVSVKDLLKVQYISVE